MSARPSGHPEPLECNLPSFAAPPPVVSRHRRPPPVPARRVGLHDMTPSELSGPALDLRRVHAALAKTTEALAGEVGRPGASTPDWSDMEWQVAKAVSAIHGVSGLLLRSSRWRGPQHWHAFLAQQSEQLAARLPRIQLLLSRIDEATRSAGIPCVALKGSALHAHGLYGPGERPMADVDLLVRDADAPAAAPLLESLGFRAGVVTWKHRVFTPVDACKALPRLGESAMADLKIEVHGAIRELLPLRAVDISPLVFPQQASPGLNDYPTRAALLLHILLHASGAMINRTLRLLHLSDTHRLVRTMSAADWEETFRLARGTDDPSLWWAFPPLALTQRYFGGIPQEVLNRMAAASPWLLRRVSRRRTLSQVSISYLWVSALPGIEWSRSHAEMSTYALQRLFPSRDTRALRVAYADAQPEVNGGEWAYTSQSRRIVRWLLAPQPRQETMVCVRAALAPCRP